MGSRVTLALIALCALAGCGRADDERAVAAVTDRFVTAVVRDAGDVTCAQMTPATAEALAEDEGEPCDQAARGIELTAATVVRTDVFGIAAKADLSDGTSAFLELTSQGWRVSAAGCTPVAGDTPYECEIES